MNKLLATLLATLLTAAGCKSRNENSLVLADEERPVEQVFIAINGRGGDGGELGHAYLVLNFDQKNIFDSMTYHFYVTHNETNQVMKAGDYLPKLPRLILVGPDNSLEPTAEFPYVFTVQKQTFIDNFVRSTMLLNRNLFFFKLKLNDAQRQAILRGLAQEERDRTEHPRFDYNLLTFNCLHAALRVVNHVLETDRQIVIPPLDSQWYELRFGKIDQFAQFIPVVLLYHLVKDYPELIDADASRTLKGGQRSLAMQLDALRGSLRFFGLLATETGAKYTDTQLKALLYGLVMPDASFATMDRVLHAQIFKKATPIIQRKYDDELRRLAENAKCVLEGTPAIKVHLNSSTCMQEQMAVLFKFAPESYLDFLQEAAPFFPHLVENGRDTAKEVYADYDEDERFKSLENRLSACQIKEPSSREAFLVYVRKLAHRNLFYEGYRQLVLAAQKYQAQDNEEREARNNVPSRILQDIGGLCL